MREMSILSVHAFTTSIPFPSTYSLSFFCIQMYTSLSAFEYDMSYVRTAVRIYISQNLSEPKVSLRYH